MISGLTPGAGWGGLLAVMAIRRYGRLPVLFWSQVEATGLLLISESVLKHRQVLALGFLIGCALAPNLNTFAGESPASSL